jgi:hypothetical protein
MKDDYQKGRRARHKQAQIRYAERLAAGKMLVNATIDDLGISWLRAGDWLKAKEPTKADIADAVTRLIASSAAEHADFL